MGQDWLIKMRASYSLPSHLASLKPGDTTRTRAAPSSRETRESEVDPESTLPWSRDSRILTFCLAASGLVHPKLRSFIGVNNTCMSPNTRALEVISGALRSSAPTAFLCSFFRPVSPTPDALSLSPCAQRWRSRGPWIVVHAPPVPPLPSMAAMIVMSVDISCASTRSAPGPWHSYIPELINMNNDMLGA
ncbi:hypothetical protein AB1N83_004054 [Pleurotus pulmonarius]